MLSVVPSRPEWRQKGSCSYKISGTNVNEFKKTFFNSNKDITCWQREINMGVMALESGVVPR